MTDPQTTCHKCGALLMLTPSGAVCSRDHRCGGLRLNVDRGAIAHAWNVKRDEQYVLSLPAAVQSGYDKQVEPLYTLTGKPGKWWRVINVCEADSGLVRKNASALPAGSVLGRLKIKDIWWVCVFTDGSDPEEHVSDTLRDRISRAHLEAKFLDLEADLT